MLVPTPSSHIVPQNTKNNTSPQNIQEVRGSIYINPQSHITKDSTANQVLEILMTNIGGANTSGQTIESIVYNIQGVMDQLNQKELSIIANAVIPEGTYSQALYDIRLHAKMLITSL